MQEVSKEMARKACRKGQEKDSSNLCRTKALAVGSKAQGALTRGAPGATPPTSSFFSNLIPTKDEYYSRVKYLVKRIFFFIRPRLTLYSPIFSQLVMYLVQAGWALVAFFLSTRKNRPSDISSSSSGT